MTQRSLLSTVLGTVLVFMWGGMMWAGGAYDRFLHPLPGGEAVLRALDSAPTSGMYVYPSAPEPDPTKSKEECDRMSAVREAQFRGGPIVMMAITKGGQDPGDPRMFVRGVLVEFLATAMLVAAIGLAGSANGRLRRFLALQAMVAFMALATHMVVWAFMSAPNEWTAVMMFDSWVGWTLAGLPAVFLMRARRAGDMLPD